MVRSDCSNKKKHLFQGMKKFLLLPVSLLILSCDFDDPSSFSLPTWYIDLKMPLLDDTYPLEGMVDSVNIFSASDSLGMQIIFNGDLPDTSIDSSFLEVPVNKTISFSQDPVASPDITIVIDTTINISIPLTPGQLVNATGTTFNIPPTEDQTVLAAIWNDLASKIDTVITQTIDLPELSASDLPDFITSVDAFIIADDNSSDSSFFYSSLSNNGVPTNIENVQFLLKTARGTGDTTLAEHTKAAVADPVTTEETDLIGGIALEDHLELSFGFSVEETSNPTVTISTGDSVQVNVSMRIRVAGFDSVQVTAAETDLAPEIPAIAFPSDIEIYRGVFRDDPEVNRILVPDISSSFPFDLTISMEMGNFIPPAGRDSISINTTVNKNTSYKDTLFLDGYTLINSSDPTKPVEEIELDLSAVLEAQTMTLPLDGSDLGALNVSMDIEEFHFDSLKAFFIKEFPPSNQEMTGIPQGFSGMTFSDVAIEFLMSNQIGMPVELDIKMVGKNTVGDSLILDTRIPSLAVPTFSDTAFTKIRLGKYGTTVFEYSQLGTWDTTYTDPPDEGEVTIVDILSFNPEFLTVESGARLNGLGTIVPGKMIGGSYQLIAPFDVVMEPMTFIPKRKTKVKDMDLDTRNRIRKTLAYATLTSNVTNSMPVGGEISILLSNRKLFPLDTTRKSLNTLRDSLGWSPGDSLYIITGCENLDPSTGNYFIFDVMDDYSDCMDDITYLVKSSASAIDTVVSYVDTLVKISLPEPNELSEQGTVVTPTTSFTQTTVIDAKNIKILTGYRDKYIAPRIHLNGTNGERVYLTQKDYIQITSFIVWRMSNDGLISETPDELVLTAPNGGETLHPDSVFIIQWKTLGKIKTIDLHYSVGSEPDDDDWVEIITDSANVDSFLWTPSSTIGISSLTAEESDSLRIRVTDADSDVEDISGWYFRISTGNGKRMPKYPIAFPEFNIRGNQSSGQGERGIK